MHAYFEIPFLYNRCEFSCIKNGLQGNWKDQISFTNTYELKNVREDLEKQLLLKLNKLDLHQAELEGIDALYQEARQEIWSKFNWQGLFAKFQENPKKYFPTCWDLATKMKTPELLDRLREFRRTQPHVSAQAWFVEPPL